ncbi:HPr family phosphocarrier protein [Nocardia bovistercoris]|uniref:Uncharacterized protein n=1 Tax=Nocardia bovistercoris TaxID=2785916 RepID=A0A931N5L7_9NOCA|nr:hypothetical protein [Nocardia bovistercoris]MBH0779989.1 hypothetical protein [Nocardia bovistercoris]
MYVEEIRSTRTLGAQDAEDLAAVAAGFSSRITISSGGRSVNAPVLPYCWDVLRVRPGSVISVTVEEGRHPPDIEDRRALSAFAGRMRKLLAARPVPPLDPIR